MSTDCIFCKIVNKEINADKVYEDSNILAFKDLNPVAPVHILFIPKKHVCCVNDISEDNSGIVSGIFCAISKVAKDLGLDNKGYRVINNCGKDGGQTVMHLHFHLIGGKRLGWPGVE